MMRQRETPKSHFLLPEVMQKQGQSGGPSGKLPWTLPLTGEVLVGGACRPLGPEPTQNCGEPGSVGGVGKF